MAFTTNGLTAKVENGKLDYSYTDSSEKKANGSELGYDQFLQLLCAEMQYQDPLEPTSNTDYVAQLATFSQLEAVLEQTTLQQGNMANSLVGKDVILCVEDEKTGSMNYVEGRVDYVMYQNGEAYLSVNDSLYPLSSLDTVADDQYYDAVTLAKNFSKMVELLPDVDNVTTTYKGAIQQLRELYDGLTDYQKKFISEDDLTALKKVEERLNELLAAEEATEGGSEGTEEGEPSEEEVTEEA
ncbi:MAG: flagellar hook capping FlgD N-terminal domain-containing protein [Lachnospiraceae bacterium]|nr:flagellar hook capping FlgD N-terminal domain-containing protein [Lachnospiraceae bacterium]